MDKMGCAGTKTPSRDVGTPDQVTVWRAAPTSAATHPDGKSQISGETQLICQRSQELAEERPGRAVNGAEKLAEAKVVGWPEQDGAKARPSVIMRRDKKSAQTLEATRGP